MKNFVLVILIAFGSSAFAASSACVVYVDSSGAQFSCDGSDLKDLLTSSGISAAISKSIPHFLDLGYTLNGCTDSYSNGPQSGGSAYSRCYFTKK